MPRKYSAAVETQNLLFAVRWPATTREDMTGHYVDCLIADEAAAAAKAARIDWPTLDNAIRTRWSGFALDVIQKEARRRLDLRGQLAKGGRNPPHTTRHGFARREMQA